MLKVRQRLGKYRIQKRLADGGFASVYKAMDTIEGINVALKIPHSYLIDDGVLTDFRHEVRLAARLDHVNILPLKNASFIDDLFVIAFPLGEKTLADRLRSRISVTGALDYTGQMIDAVAYAHRHRIIHCDVKPENFIIFSGNRIRLTDFGIAKIALNTIRASGSGTIGFMPPEQAMGKPSLRSDVFSLGLIIYRMFSGELPEWPFEWPAPGHRRLRSRVHPDMIAFLRKAIDVNPRKRFRDAVQMQAAFPDVREKTLQSAKRRARARKRNLTASKRNKSSSRKRKR
ncbi:MAG: serine/threonine protein kinase [Planctomycetes bacterium]|nr:serine/threonine protein kinase [Planctomycetota bacterium]